MLNALFLGLSRPTYNTRYCRACFVFVAGASPCFLSNSLALTLPAPLLSILFLTSLPTFPLSFNFKYCQHGIESQRVRTRVRQVHFPGYTFKEALSGSLNFSMSTNFAMQTFLTYLTLILMLFYSLDEVLRYIITVLFPLSILGKLNDSTNK